MYAARQLLARKFKQKMINDTYLVSQEFKNSPKLIIKAALQAQVEKGQMLLC